MRRILITGATSAIGSALAMEYAAPHTALVLHGRNAARLEAVAQACRARGAEVQTQRLDVRDTDAWRAWLASLGALDLVVANAGLNTHVGPSGEPEPWEEVEALLEVNLRAVMVLVHAVLPAMRARGGGHIALMGSLAGWFGLPVTPTYSATKAALKAYAEGLHGWLAPQGIRVSVVMPGYVDSPMCAAMPGPKPLRWSPARAARRIRRGLDRGQLRVSFPFPLNWGTWWLAVLPPAWSVRLVRWMGYGRGGG